MNFEKIKELMKILDSSELMDFELKLNEDFYLRMNKHRNKDDIKVNKNKTFNIKSESNSFKTDVFKDFKEEITPVKEEIKPVSLEGNIITSPIVGTFYSSSSPSKPPFVKIGDKVKQGDTLCIIEAMKVMNEIKTQFDGEIAEILVENNEMVEFNQPLFRII